MIPCWEILFPVVPHSNLLVFISDTPSTSSAVVAKIPGHCHEQFVQTLIVCFLKTYLFLLFLILVGLVNDIFCV